MSKRSLEDMFNPASAITPRDTVSLLPPKTNRAKRTRRWEHKNRTVTFHIPQRLSARAADVRGKIARAAEREYGLVDQVSHAFMRYALHCYERGQIQITPRPSPVSRTLILEWEEQRQGWPVDLTVTPKAPAKKEGKTKYISFSFRWKDNTYQSVIAIARKQAVLPGELAIVFLEHAIEQYSLGRLKLKKNQHAVEQQITGWVDQK